MIIDPKAELFGHRTLLVRNVLRKFPFSGGDSGRHWSAARRILDEKQLRVLLDKLAENGYLERTKFRREGTEFFYRTEKGQRLAMASARCIRRKTAERMLKRVIERAREINQDDKYVYRIQCLVVFGSFLDEKRERLGDLDVAYQVSQRFPGSLLEPESPHERAWNASIRRAQEEGRGFSNMVEETCWPDFEWLRALKGRAAGLSLHKLEDDALIILKGPHKVVFGQIDESFLQKKERKVKKKPELEVRVSLSGYSGEDKYELQLREVEAEVVTWDQEKNAVGSITAALADFSVVHDGLADELFDTIDQYHWDAWRSVRRNRSNDDDYFNSSVKEQGVNGCMVISRIDLPREKDVALLALRTMLNVLCGYVVVMGQDDDPAYWERMGFVKNEDDFMVWEPNVINPTLRDLNEGKDVVQVRKEHREWYEREFGSETPLKDLN